jgi:hypothetical protein
MPAEAVYRQDQNGIYLALTGMKQVWEAFMKRFGIVMGGIFMIGLLLASSGCYVGHYRGYDHQGYYRGYDRDYNRYDNRYRRW